MLFIITALDYFVFFTKYANIICKLMLFTMKKITSKIIAVITAAFILSFSFLSPVMAEGEGNEPIDNCRSFLGMVSWDCNTNLTGGNNIRTDDLTTGIWMIVLNVLSDISVIATYLALGFVIYGGYQYIFSSGDPAKVVTGKKTLVHAFAGIAIVMSASVILNAIRIAMGANFAIDCTAAGNASAENGCFNYSDANVMVDSFINWFIAISGLVAAIFVIYGGIAYMTSSGDPNKLQKAKNIIIYALAGLAIVGLAKVITAFAISSISQANESSYINTSIVKELHD